MKAYQLAIQIVSCLFAYLCRKKQYATIVSVYAPTLQADPTTKESFYGELRSLLENINSKDKIFILGDFNARVGRLVGRLAGWQLRRNGRLLLELCAEYSLTITNTLFQQKARFKTTLGHPRSKHWHPLDYVLVRQKDKKDVLHTRVMPSADCYTDHRLLHSIVRIVIKPDIKKRSPQIKALQVNLLPMREDRFQSELERTPKQQNLKGYGMAFRMLYKKQQQR